MNTPIRYWPRVALTAVACFVMSAILIVPIVVTSLIFPSGWPQYRMTRVFAFVAAKIMGVSWSLRDGHKITPGQSYIICPNHQSHSDILALLLALPIPFKWVIKKELVSIPLFGWGLARTGAISIDRSNSKAAVKKLRESAHKASGGWSVLVYPEGTRSPDGNFLPFKKGAFMLAVGVGVPILPVTVNGAHKVLPKKTLRMTPGHITVTIGDPIPTEGRRYRDVPELMEKTRLAIMENFDPDYDPFSPSEPKQMRESA